MSRIAEQGMICLLLREAGKSNKYIIIRFIMERHMQRLCALSITFLLGLVLAGCAQMAMDQNGSNAQPGQSAAAEQSQAQAASVAVYLAQAEEHDGLKKVQLGEHTAWYLPEPALTRSDLASVEPRKTNNGQAFVRMVLTQSGAQKLASVTQTYPGKLLLVTVAGNLVSAVRIQQPVTDGTLNVAVQSDQQARNVVQAIAGTAQKQQTTQKQQ